MHRLYRGMIHKRKLKEDLEAEGSMKVGDRNVKVGDTSVKGDQK